MPPSPESASSTLPASLDVASPPAPDCIPPKSEDLPYMTMTVVAILLLLGSLWVF
jgi:hypothetical protein